MTRDDILRMAREADLTYEEPWGECSLWKPRVDLTPYLERFAALVAAAERDECAKVCDTTPPQPFRPSIEAAHAIRARGTK